jgi:hypothetical protein
MEKSIFAKQKKPGRGRPRTGSHPMLGLRASPELRAAVEAWAKGQEDKPKLSEAIRRLVELGLTVKASAKSVNKPTRSARAADRSD